MNRGISFFQLGLGGVGSSLLYQEIPHLNAAGVDHRMVADTQTIVLSRRPQGFTPEEGPLIAQAKKEGVLSGVGDVIDAEAFPYSSDFLARLTEFFGSRVIIGDFTSSPTITPHLIKLHDEGNYLVLVNKLGLASPDEPTARYLFASMLEGTVRARATTCADLGVLNRELEILQSGNITSLLIEGAMSGTLNVQATWPGSFSSGVTYNNDEGNTEVTPHTDYFGKDSLNKGLAPAKLLAVAKKLPFSAISVRHVPFYDGFVNGTAGLPPYESLAALGRSAFAEKSKAFDPAFDTFRASLQPDETFRYVTEVSYDPSEPTNIYVSAQLKRMPKSHALAQGEGTMNTVFFSGSNLPPEGETRNALKGYGAGKYLGPDGKYMYVTPLAARHDIEAIVRQFF